MITQKDGISCGPVALINAYYYNHGKYPNVTTQRLMCRCLTNDEVGTYRWNMKNGEIIRLGKPTYNLNRIKRFDACILLYSFGEDAAHYVFVRNDGNSYTLYNYCDDNTDGYVHLVMTSGEFDELLRANPRVNGLDYPLAWSVKSLACLF